MANVDSKEGWIDLGRYKSIKCIKLPSRVVCEVKFTEGKVTLIKEELQKICKNIPKNG